MVAARTKSLSNQANSSFVFQSSNARPLPVSDTAYLCITSRLEMLSL